MIIVSRIDVRPIEKFASMSLDKFALFLYYDQERPERISAARWAAMHSQFKEAMKWQKSLY